MSQPTVNSSDSSPTPPAVPPAKTVASLVELFWIFLQIGAMSFGGGLTAWVHREIVTKRGWMNETEFLTGLALSQVLPGVNVINLGVHVGQRLRGAIGSIVCVVATVFVPFFVVIGLVTVYNQIKEWPWLSDFLDGVAVAAVGLMVSVALRSVRGTFHGLAPYTIAIALIVMVGVLRWPIIPIVLTLAPLSVLCAWLTRNRTVGER